MFSLLGLFLLVGGACVLLAEEPLKIKFWFGIVPIVIGAVSLYK